DQSPLDEVERTFTCLVVRPNDQQLLAWCSIVAWGNIAHSAIPDVEAFDNREPERPRLLNYTHILRSALRKESVWLGQVSGLMIDELGSICSLKLDLLLDNVQEPVHRLVHRVLVSDLRLLGEDFCHHLQEDVRLVLGDLPDCLNAMLLPHREHVFEELLAEPV